MQADPPTPDGGAAKPAREKAPKAPKEKKEKPVKEKKPQGACVGAEPGGAPLLARVATACGVPARSCAPWQLAEQRAVHAARPALAGDSKKETKKETKLGMQVSKKDNFADW